MGRMLLAIMMFMMPLIVISSDRMIRANTGDSYTVKRGDSLWTVAEYFLENPSRWPELWQANPHFHNPHLIYPGDVISLTYINGKPKLRVSNSSETKRTIKLSPKIRSAKISQAIPAIPLNTINKFLKEDRIVSLATELSRAPYIFAIANNRIAASNGDKVYARGHIYNENAQHEIIRRGEKIKDPRTGQLLGIIGYKVADAKLLEFNKGIASIEVVGATMAVKKGDRLLIKESFAPVTTFYPKPPVESVVGRVLAVVNGGKKAGKHDTVIVDLGHRQSMQPGDILVVKEPSKARDPVAEKSLRLPPRDVGMVMIYRSFDSLSYGIVMSAKEELQVGDYLTNP